ncbi:MAG: MFS transporter [Lachnospiraceae bacterium]|nr:MFS transporter [Lachnospiraceae bacterium]
MGKRQKWMITIGCFFSYFLFGAVDNMKGSVLPVLLQDVGFDHSLGGMIISSEYTGFFLATFLAGLIADRFGKKVTLILAGLSLSLGVSGYAASSGFISFIGFIFLIGLGLGSLELSGSDILSGIWTVQKGRYLNLLNACYGMGSILAPMAVGYLLQRAVPWRVVYRYSLLIILPITLYFIIMRYPREDKKRERKKKIDRRELLAVITQKRVLLMYTAIFAYVAAEVGMATWFVGFLQNEKQISAAGSSAYFAIYFAGMTIGRLLGSLFVDRLGHMKSLLLFTALSGLFLAVGIFGPSSAAIFLAFTGFGFSIIFPTATTVVSGIPSKNPSILLGSFFAVGGVGGMVGPYLVGLVNDLLGMEKGMAMELVFCALLMASLLINVCGKNTGRCETYGYLREDAQRGSLRSDAGGAGKAADPLSGEAL